MLDGRHVASSGASDRHRSLIKGSSGVDSSNGRDLHRSDGWRWTLLMITTYGIGRIAIVHSPEAPSDGREDSWKNSTIAVRSNRDRGAIEPRLWIFHRGITSTRSHGDRVRPRIMIDTRSWPDRGAIVVLLKRN